MLVVTINVVFTVANYYFNIHASKGTKSGKFSSTK